MELPSKSNPDDAIDDGVYLKLYSHPFPDSDEIGFQVFPTYKEQMLSPDYTIVRGNETDRFVEINTAFYKIYHDSNNRFKRYLFANPELKNIDATIYNVPIFESDPKLNGLIVRIDRKAIDEFIKYLKTNVYSKLEFLDIDSSHVKLRLMKESTGEKDKMIYDKLLKEKHVSSLLVQFRFDMQYLEVKKTIPKEKKTISDVVKKTSKTSIPMDIFDNSAYQEKHTMDSELKKKPKITKQGPTITEQLEEALKTVVDENKSDDVKKQEKEEQVVVNEVSRITTMPEIVTGLIEE